MSNDTKKLHVGTSPLTNRIFAGHVLKDGHTWASNKTDVTGTRCAGKTGTTNGELTAQ